ncbi:hypothetical protein SAMN05421788_105375 [Filimonas lacunae]|uniref:DUF6298 domain-containing protein n=1 Tax=Filimonas lacunae TaxID=477680 RepID=A0A1N7QJZ7_9BACT|nr:DUF6298 domain-containing protein [Filimonas lacunae]SIT22827.1 hypothetical protein SAMN05421788_105375 [Filimonas lacunae]
MMPVAGNAQQKKPVKPLPPVSLGAGGRLVYTADEQGNRIPDFSYSGYMGGSVSVPVAPVRVVVPVAKGDNTRRIQAALDYVAALPADKQGIRGAVLLQAGEYRIEGGLAIKASGVVLRGSGSGANGTVLLGAGYTRQTLITVGGVNNRRLQSSHAVTSVYVPVNAMSLQVADAGSFKAGDKVVIQRPCTAAWIEQLGTDHFGGGITSLGWKPGQRNLQWDRTVTGVKGNELQLDAPITTALDTTYGGGTVAAYSWQGRISQSGVENLRLRSEYDAANSKDEDHRWMAIVIENATDIWVRQMVFEHFAGSAVAIQETGSHVTVEDAQSLQPVSEIGGQRRYTFFTSGQQCLFQRLYAEYGYHDFATGYCAAGPNAFVQCESHLPFSFSGGIDSWASGVLFDIVNVDGEALSYKNRGQDGQGAGWAAANSVFWQCSAARVDCYRPPGAQNWAFGTWAQFSGDGYWDNSNESIHPRSLYYAQLADRLGSEVAARTWLLPVETEASSSPSVEVAAELTAQAVQPRKTLREFIEQAATRVPLPTSNNGVKTIEQVGVPAANIITAAGIMQVSNGWLVRGSNVLTGIRREVPWWNGSVRPHGLPEAKPHITRFVPGRTGTGLTDNLDDMTDSMKATGMIALDHNYGLWYERRRDDHERIRRIDGEVWPPFYELPFARSGQGSAWDGLSKYDLTKYNKFYWGRLQQYANLADEKGLVLIHENYFQHNIIEAGAHYADFPWRTANNVNNTGFPEPVPYAGDKRIFMAEQFYDISNPERRKLHRAYIRQCLNNFAANNGVVQLIGAEFTGPLHFVQFWIDIIQEWETETGKTVVVGLSTTKDVQDAILQDAARAKTVNLIDIRYWHYQFDGKSYAPEGGRNLAPRQWARLLKPKRSSFEQVYRAVSEYRKQYPGKAVMYSGDGYDAFGWAAFMAGGSLCNIPAVNSAFLAAASATLPADTTTGESGCYWLTQPGKTYILYTTGATAAPSLNLTGVQGNFVIRWINARTGAVEGKEEKVKGGSVIQLQAPKANAIAWVNKV